MNANQNNNDPHGIDEARLTAYALGQLDDAERAEVESLLAESDEARKFVAETASLAGHVHEAYQQSPQPAADPSIRAAIEQHLTDNILDEAKVIPRENTKKETWWISRHWVDASIVSAALLLFAGFFLPRIQSSRECARNTICKNELAQHGQSQKSAGMPDDIPATLCEEDVLGYPLGADTLSMELGWKELDHAYQAQRIPPNSSLPPPVVYPNKKELRRPLSDSRMDMQISEEQRKRLEKLAHGNLTAEERNKLRKRAEEAGIVSVYPCMGKLRDSEGNPFGSRSAQPPGTEQYDRIVENHFRPVDKQPLSTFSIDVDTASYANMRRFINEGRLPPPDAVRIEEMVNYFTYDYPQPTDDTPFSVNMETAQCPWQPEHRLLRIGLKGREIDRSELGPSNLVFLLDVSGSMNQSNKLPLVKRAMRMLVEQLTEDDRVAIVTYASGVGVPLPSARGNEQKRILDKIDSLQAGGSTHGSAGIELAYNQAAEHFVRKGINRVILCTDGDLNVGITNDDDLVKLIEQKAKSGVFLTVLGFGTGNLKDSKMEKLADHGNGMYAYVDSLREARRVLIEQMTGNLATIAKDVKLQIEFNPAEVAAYRLIGYENRVLANRDFDDDRKDAGEIGAGNAVTALYELIPAGVVAGETDERPLRYQRVPERNQTEAQPGGLLDRRRLNHAPKLELTEAAHGGELLTLRLRYKGPDGEKSKLLERTLRDSDAGFGQASPDFRFASAVATFGMVLRESSYKGDATLAAAEEYATGALGRDPNGHRAEFLDLIRRARSIAPGK